MTTGAPDFGHADHRDAELSVYMHAQAGLCTAPKLVAYCS